MYNRLSVAREISYDAFVKVMAENRDPNEVTESLFSKANPPLKRIDRAFVKELLFGSLRWYSKIYWIVEKTAKRNLDATPDAIRASLVLGTYQIFYMDKVPDRAAVNESVEYVRQRGQAKAVGFVNGVLRSISRRAEYFAKPDKDKQPCDYLALQYAHPAWITKRWLQRFHFDRMKTILAANNQPPPYSIRVNTNLVSQDHMQEFRNNLLRDEKVHVEGRPLRCCLHLKSTPMIDKESFFARGFYTIQDESSQLVGMLVSPQPKDRVLDACGGKGGKAGHMYELAHGDLDLVVVEKNPIQMKKAQDTFRRLTHVNGVTWHVGDFFDYKTDDLFDRILLDAPCSGLGVIRRHPEGKWQKKRDIISYMAKIQKEMLLHAFDLLKVGGEIVFSVCSYENEETIDQLEWLKEHFADKIEVISPLGRIPSYYRQFVTKEQVFLVFSGNEDGMDGFGAFIIKKVKP